MSNPKPLQQITEPEARLAADQYLSTVLGSEYSAGQSSTRENGYWQFAVLCKRSDMPRVPTVGFLTVDATTGQVDELSADQLREMRESGAVQAAHEGHGALARDGEGRILRRQARIKAQAWASNHIGMKVGVIGGDLVAGNPPRWRFPIVCHLNNLVLEPLDTVDVDAHTGWVMPLSDSRIQAVREDISAAIRDRALAPAT